LLLLILHVLMTPAQRPLHYSVAITTACVQNAKSVDGLGKISFAALIPDRCMRIDELSRKLEAISAMTADVLPPCRVVAAGASQR
jgi:hypothetical protein